LASFFSFVNQFKMRKGTLEYLENKREIVEIDRQIESGAFATIAIIVDDRLFVANVGTVHCFVCTYDRNTLETVVSTLEIEHSLSNITEVLRWADLNAFVDENHDDIKIKYTRCLGDFKNKLYYHENPQFRLERR
jgi:serine/threonine protein phosphatase PrpC